MSEFFTFKEKRRFRLIEKELRAAKLFPVLSFDPEGNTFLCEEGRMGFGFVCQPLSGADEKIEQQVNSLLNENYPSNKEMQVILYRSPDINKQMAYMKSLREGYKHELYEEFIDQRSTFLKTHTDEPLVLNDKAGIYNLGTVHDLKLYITFKVPISGNQPGEKDYKELRVLQTKARTTLENIHLYPSSLTAEEWVRFMNTVFNWGKGTTWRNHVNLWDQDQPLCNQVLDYDNDIEVSRDYIRVGDKYIKALSSKRKPESMYFGEAVTNSGDLSGGTGGVRTNYMVCTSIIFPEVDGEKQKFERKRQFTINQASGPIVKFVPILLDKKNDFDTLYQSIQEGKKLFKLSHHVIIFGNSLEEVEAASMTARNFWRTNRYEIMEDKSIQMPVLLNCLPFCGDFVSRNDLQRHKTMTSKEAAPLLPIMGEWKGTGTPHINLISRNQQIMNFSFHDTGSNMNAVTAAQSGSGKSFLTNEIVTSYLSEGAQVWIIDVGRSYKNLCEAFEGDFLHFGASSKACMNPFPLVVSLDGTMETRAPDAEYNENDNDDDGEEDALIGLIEAMAAPNQKLSDFQISSLKRVFSKVWRTHFRKTSIDHVADALLEHEDIRVKDIGNQLYAFTSKGSYGRFFNGENNVKFNNQLTVLELEELKGRKHLQQVVLLQLIYQIQQEMYLGDRSRKKVVVIDEAWDLLTSGDVAKFIEAGYRRFRKYGGSVNIISQSVNDLYDSKTGRAIAENSATTILLGQKSETIDQIKRDGKIQMSDYHFEQLKTVHTLQGVYSELFIISEYGRGIGRLIVNDYQKLLYSTKAEDVSAIQKKRDQGMNLNEAIVSVLKDRKNVDPSLGQVA